MDKGSAFITGIATVIAALIGIAGGWAGNEKFSAPSQIVDIRLNDGTQKAVRVDEAKEVYSKYLKEKEENNRLQKSLEQSQKNIETLQNQRSSVKDLLTVCESKLLASSKHADPKTANASYLNDSAEQHLIETEEGSFFKSSEFDLVISALAKVDTKYNTVSYLSEQSKLSTAKARHYADIAIKNEMAEYVRNTNVNSYDPEIKILKKGIDYTLSKGLID